MTEEQRFIINKVEDWRRWFAEESYYKKPVITQEHCKELTEVFERTLRFLRSV